MKKLISILALIFLFCNNSSANPNNPTNDWLQNKTVNQLTQEYGYKLFSVNNSGDFTVYTLTNKKVVVSCLVAGGPDLILFCYLP